VHQPERPPDRDLPVGDALQVAAELGLDQLTVGLERRWVRLVLGDDARRLRRPRQRAVDDPREPGVAQLFTERCRLRPSQRAELEAVEMAVQDVVRVLDVGVPDQIDAGQLRYAPTVVRFVPAERPESRAL
jgi:hypothetical protein